MKILGRTTSNAFDDFYSSVEDELSVLEIEVKSSSEMQRDVYGDFSGRCRVNLDEMKANIWISPSIPAEAFSSVVGHEYCHILQKLRGFYEPSISPQLGAESVEAQVSVLLSESTECVAVNCMLNTYSIDTSWAIGERYTRWLSGLRKAQRTRMEIGKPNFVENALKYIRAGLEQPEERWLRLKRGYELKRPDAAETGVELLGLVKDIGLDTVENRLESMLVIRNGLRLQGRIYIENRRTGHRL